jgi:hypothetical protein
MSIAVISKFNSGMTAEKYEKLTEAMDLQDALPKGCESHTAGIAEDGSFIISDIWESSEAFETFSRERLIPTCNVLDIAAPENVTMLDLVRAHVRSFHMSRSSKSFHMAK